MSVLFVVYMPNEDLKDQKNGENNYPDSPSSSLSLKNATENGSDNDGGGENEVDVPRMSIDIGDDDEISPQKPLLENVFTDQTSSQSTHSPPDDNKVATKHQSLLKQDKSVPHWSSENVLNNAENTKSDVECASDNVVYKGDKVRFQVTKLDTPDTDGVKQSVAELASSVTELVAETKEEKKQSLIPTEEADVVMERLTLEEVIREVLDEFDIDTDVWNTTKNERLLHLTFTVSSAVSDHVLDRLILLGFGRIPETYVSLFSTTVHYQKEEDDVCDKKSRSERSEFMKSIKSRLTVSQVVLAVQSNAKLTFDYVTLIALASMLAALGLAESSSVVLVASMLVSPLMGPIVGFTFGAIIKNQNLWRISIRNELIGLSICVLFGFLFGLITGGINNTGAVWGASDSWPTVEMQSRGMARSLWVGVLIAVPSGAGVALSVLGGNTGSLVGVAISASLLPPAVNAGILWGVAFVAACSHPETTVDES